MGYSFDRFATILGWIGFVLLFVNVFGAVLLVYGPIGVWEEAKFLAITILALACGAVLLRLLVFHAQRIWAKFLSSIR